MAGLAAIQTAKNMGAVVRAFDVRAVTKEQVESTGAEFLEVEVAEDGAGQGGVHQGEQAMRVLTWRVEPNM